MFLCVVVGGGGGERCYSESSDLCCDYCLKNGTNKDLGSFDSVTATRLGDSVLR